jgi:glycosyltransferase involved in cell wall biosynthesis
MKGLRILHLNSLLKGGGTDDQCVKLVQGLRQLGHEVWIAGPEGRDYSRIVRKLDLPFFPIDREGPAKIRFMIKAAQFIRRQQIQIVHGHHGRDIWPTILAAKLSGRRPKIVLTRHLAKSPASWGTRRFMLGQCDLLIAVSEFVARVLKEGVYEPDSPEPERRARPPVRGDYRKIRVVYGGIDTQKFQPREAAALRAEWGLAPKDFAFAVIGSYDQPRGKGQREFLQAAARVHAKIPEARFLIVGRGNLAPVLREDIDRLNLKGKAWLTPYCHDMPAAMNAIDCLAHPQVGTEALGLVVCEAHACGKPVIASALDGIPEAFQIGGYGQLTVPESIEELSAALERWAVQPRPSEVEREVLHARVQARFSLARMAQDMAQLYQNLLA